MKKLTTIALVLAAGVAFVHAQGTITMSTTADEAYTNNGVASGGTFGNGNFKFEVLDMTQSVYAGLTSQEQAGIYDLYANPSDLSLWTDSGISGQSSTHPGGITSTAGSANDWVAPTSSAGYNTAPNYDYYTIIGWSASGPGSEGATYSAFAANVSGDTLVAGGFWGQSGTAYNYAGGGASGLPAVGLFSGSSATQLAGSGGLPSVDAVTLYAVPEPATLALAGMGGLSMLFLRRRKS